ncbi:hypothetical protein Vadar_021762 [Vaccinium darrowii]|uniref:Uncharacterized protein n=1 Tax=Vaccinium darrowii TaxID=229202 RepID=A0ACB7XKA6_9ERIC|nr:hypothetical protein Vadar_021762 [Vaccinium darrowii]
MASTKCFSMFLFVIAIFLSTSATEQEENPVRMARGLHAFGDSAVDSGNAYVGVNTPFGQNVADFIASLLGLPHALPYVSLTDEVSDATIAGINFAVAGARILPETGQEFINDVLLTGVHFSVSND